MTKQDIIKASFIVWGRALYKKMNLTDVAEFLGVTKPALYRHFPNKDALLEALYTDFFDRYVAFLEQVLPSLQRQMTLQDRAVAIAKIMAEYFINNKYDFLFFLYLVQGQEKPGRVFKEELERRGLSVDSLDACQGDKGFLSLLRMVSVTVVFYVALFHVRNTNQVDEIPGDVATEAIQSVTELVQRGLCSIDAVSQLPDFAALDGAFTLLVHPVQEQAGDVASVSGRLLAAVAKAIGEAGPWEASMNFVAQITGLSKSGLYAHFPSKRQMIRQLFLNEFDTLGVILEKTLTISPQPLDRLYLTMRTVWYYLISHKDILRLMDWIRLHRIDLGMLIPERSLTLLRFVRNLPLRPTFSSWDLLTLVSWVLFLVVNQLMVELRQGIGEADSLQNLKDLYIYMTTGVKGWTT